MYTLSHQAIDAADDRDIRRLLRRVALRDPLREVTLKLLEGRATTEDDLPALFREVQHPRARRWRECLLAVWALGRIETGPRRQRRLALSLAAIVDGKRPNDLLDAAVGQLMTTTLWLGILVVALGSIPIVFGGTNGFVPEAGRIGSAALFGIIAGGGTAVVAMILLGPIAVPLLMALYRLRSLTARASAARVLGVWKSAQTVGPLARASRNRDTSLRREAIVALNRTLDGLTEDDYGQVPARDQYALLSLAGTCDEAFMVRVLKALGKVGGGAVLRDVTQIAANAQPAEVRRAASDLIPILGARCRLERQGKTLLRPAEAQLAASPLLRPAAASGIPVGMLLRSVAAAHDIADCPDEATHRV